ncbi:hypothetical protein [Streptomyces albus]|uniref:hypothetical protein n=1 Tax=Streptomyces albus TaxID=1888 RepID=UPI003F1B13CC
MRDDFPDLARRALRDAGYSMKAAAREMHYDPAYLSRVLNGNSGPSKTSLTPWIPSSAQVVRWPEHC